MNKVALPITLFTTLALTAIPRIASAHPGHGAIDSHQLLLHQLLDHKLLVISVAVMAMGAVAIVLRRRPKRQRSSKR